MINDSLVKYHTIGGGQEKTAMSTGTVVRILTAEETVGSSPHHVAATEDDPRVLIKNDHTGKETPYKLANLVEILPE